MKNVIIYYIIIFIAVVSMCAAGTFMQVFYLWYDKLFLYFCVLMILHLAILYSVPPKKRKTIAQDSSSTEQGGGMGTIGGIVLEETIGEIGLEEGGIEIIVGAETIIVKGRRELLIQ